MRLRTGGLARGVLRAQVSSANRTARQDHVTFAGFGCDVLDEAGNLAVVSGNQVDRSESIEIDVFPAEGGGQLRPRGASCRPG